MKWLHAGWYQYLFNFDKYTGIQYAPWYEKVKVIWCRIKGHPNGPIWYNASGFEPDMCCKDCGEEL